MTLQGVKFHTTVINHEGRLMMFAAEQFGDGEEILVPVDLLVIKGFTPAPGDEFEIAIRKKTKRKSRAPASRQEESP